MIDEALGFIRREVREHLQISDAQVDIGHIHELRENQTADGVRIALVNISEEPNLRNTPHVVRSPTGSVEYQEPAVYLNAWLLIAFEFSQYDTSLLRLSQTVELFQSKRFFDASNQRAANPFPDTLQRLVFEMHSADFEQLNHLWGILGGTYFPSVVYQMRVVKVQANERQVGPEITHLEVNTRLKG